MLDLKRKVTDGSKTERVQRLSATTGVKNKILKPAENHVFQLMFSLHKISGRLIFFLYVNSQPPVRLCTARSTLNGFSTLIHNRIIVDQTSNYLCVFLWELEYLFLQKNLKSLQKILEANLQKK
jgi:hypothetical protein